MFSSTMSMKVVTPVGIGIPDSIRKVSTGDGDCGFGVPSSLCVLSHFLLERMESGSCSSDAPFLRASHRDLPSPTSS